MDYKLIEQFIDEDSGVFAISLVSNPAIERNFIALSKTIKLSINEEKRIVTGAVLVPDMPILRMSNDNTPYNIFFSKETVDKVSQKYLADHNQEQITLEHQADVPDVVLIESWIKTDETHDKTVALGVDAPLGSWVGSFKINNEDIWNNEIKKGLVRGFSIEGIFRSNKVEQSKPKKMEKDNIIDKIKELVLGKEEAPKKEVVEMATAEEFTNLCSQVETLEETIKGLVGKLEELSKAETEPDYPPNDDNGGRNPQQGPVVVPDPKAETAAIVEEVIEEAKEEEKVEMIAVTDAVEPTFKKVAFDYKLSREERIRQNIVK